MALSFPGKELRERLSIDDIALVLQQNRLHWYGYVLLNLMNGVEQRSPNC